MASIVTSIGGVIALALINWRLAVTFLLGLPACVLVIRVFVRQAFGSLARDQQIQGQIAARLLDALAGMRTIRAAGTVNQEVRRILRPLPALLANGRALLRTYGDVTAWALLLVPLVEMGVLAVAGLGLNAGWVLPGQLLATVGYTALAFRFFDRAAIFMAFAQVHTAAQRVAEVLDEPPMPAGTQRLLPGDGELQLHVVSVRAGQESQRVDQGLTVRGKE
jgi:ATP-binding cassette subfamily B protein